MSFGFWTLGAPLGLLALAGVLALLMRPHTELPTAVGTVGILWLLFTGKARKTYWNARIRAKAYDDARRARSRASRKTPSQ